MTDNSTAGRGQCEERYCTRFAGSDAVFMQRAAYQGAGRFLGGAEFARHLGQRRPFHYDADLLACFYPGNWPIFFYGTDILARHHAEFDHAQGFHR